MRAFSRILMWSGTVGVGAPTTKVLYGMPMGYGHDRYDDDRYGLV